jgi:hypothetical protein
VCSVSSSITAQTVTRRALLASAPAASAFAQRKAQVRALTSGPKHHFFGYYGIPPWNRAKTRLVCLESDFQDHLPAPNESVRIGLADPRTGRFEAITRTLAWNFQQGCMLHWNPLQDREILFNERRGADIISAAVDVENGKRRELPRAINGVSRDGRYALCLTYGRLTRMRPVVGYVGAVDPNPTVAHPDNDGVFVMDLATGKANLAVSIGTVYRRLVGRHPELKDRHMWFNHTVFNPSAKRFFFLARCWTPDEGLESAMFTANVDGKELREVIPFGKGVSHFEWRNDNEILATFRFLPGSRQKEHVLFTDGKDDYRHIGEGFLTSDGHPSFAPDHERLITDQNLPSHEKRLLLYNIKTREKAVLGSFPMYTKEFMGGDLRCDLHPRWSRDGKAVCFDALETAARTRQLHVAEELPF